MIQKNILRALIKHSENSESNQTTSHRQSLKYFVLFKNKKKNTQKSHDLSQTCQLLAFRQLKF